MIFKALSSNTGYLPISLAAGGSQAECIRADGIGMKARNPSSSGPKTRSTQWGIPDMGIGTLGMIAGINTY